MYIFWSVGRKLVAAVLVFVALTVAHAGDRASGKVDVREPLPGLVPSPRALPGVGRWQLANKYPCGRIYSIAWSPDGKKLAYSELSYVRIADAKSLETEHVLVGHTGRVTSIDWSRANRIASASNDGTVRIWTPLGVPEKVLKGHQQAVTAVAWTKDGKRLASASKDGTVRIWDPAGTLVCSLAISAPVDSVAWSPDGSRLLTGDTHEDIRLWQVDTWTAKVVGQQTGPVSALAWRPDGKQFASATWGLVEGGKRVVDLLLWKADGSLAESAVGDLSIYNLQWSPDGSVLAASYENAMLQLHRGATEVKAKMQLLPLERRTAEAPLAWSPDGKEIALGGSGSIAVVDAEDLSKSRTYPQAPVNRKPLPGFVAIDPTRSRLVTRSPEGSSDPRSLLNLEDGSATPLPDDFAHTAMSDQSFSPDGKQLVGIVDEAKLCIWSPEKRTTEPIARSEDPLQESAWSPREDRIAYRDDKGMVHVVKPDGAKVADLAFPKAAVAGIPAELAPHILRWSGAAQSIAVHVRMGVEVRQLSGGNPVSVEFGMPFAGCWLAPDLERAAATRNAGGESQFLRSWSSGGAGYKEVPLANDIDSIDCSPDAKWAAVGHDSGVCELIQLDDPSFPRHEELASVRGTCMAVAFSSDGRRVATGGWDGFVKIWRLDGSLERTLAGGDNSPVYHVYWSADDKHLLSISREGMLCRFSTDAGKVESFAFRGQAKLLHVAHGGGIPANDRRAAADELVALVEKPDGSMQIVDYVEFLKRTGQAVP